MVCGDNIIQYKNGRVCNSLRSGHFFPAFSSAINLPISGQRVSMAICTHIHVRSIPSLCALHHINFCKLLSGRFIVCGSEAAGYCL